jgi:hypothetical protein
VAGCDGRRQLGPLAGTRYAAGARGAVPGADTQWTPCPASPYAQPPPRGPGPCGSAPANGMTVH